MSTGWKIVKPETSKVRNYITNPSFETGVTGWTKAGTGGGFTQSSTYSWMGAYSGALAAGSTAVTADSNTVTVPNGGSIAITAYTYRASSTPAGSIVIRDTTNTADRATSTISSTAEWQEHNLTWTNSTGSGAACTIRLNNTTADSASIIYLDANLATLTTYNLIYGDGDTPGWKWVGTPHSSVSDMSAFNTNGGRVYDLEDDYGFRVTSAPGAGNPQINTNYLPYAIAPGASYQSTTIGVRDWSLVGWLKGSSYSDWQSKRQTLLNLFDAHRYGAGDPVTIRYTGGGSVRQIKAYYNGGLENPDVMHKNERIAPRFISTDPFFYSPNTQATILNTPTTATMQLIIAKIDGLWDVLGPPNAAGSYTNILAIAVHPNGKVIVGGTFLNFDNQASGDYLAYYDKTTDTWGVITALNAAVYSIVIDAAGIVYFGGAFTNAAGVADADYIAQWDGSSVTALGVPNTGAAAITNVAAMAIGTGGFLYITGAFSNWANVAAADNIVYWSGSAYNAMGTGLNGTGLALAYDATNGYVLIGGVFTAAGGVSNTVRIAWWNGTTYEALGSGIGTGQVNALALDATGGAYVGGSFTDFDGVDCNGIAYWNGTTAQAMGSGVETLTNVIALAIDRQGRAWMGGNFTVANGISLVDRMAIWDGSNYSQPDVDLPGSADVNAIAIDGDDVYIGSGATGTVTYSNPTTVTISGRAVNPYFKIKRSGGTSAKLIKIENVTTNKTANFNYSLQDGEEVTIDLRPGKQRFTSTIKAGGNSTVNSGDAVSSFYLIPGSNVLAVYMANVGSPTISARVYYDRLFTSFD